MYPSRLESLQSFVDAWYAADPSFIPHDWFDWPTEALKQQKWREEHADHYDVVRRWLRDTEIKPTVEQIQVDFIHPISVGGGCRLCRSCHAINCQGKYCGRKPCGGFAKDSISKTCWAGRRFYDDHDDEFPKTSV